MLRTIIITVGIALILLGLFWPLLSKGPLFRLPGDFIIQRPGTRIYFPLTSMIVISILLSLLLRWIK